MREAPQRWLRGLLAACALSACTRDTAPAAGDAGPSANATLTASAPAPGPEERLAASMITVAHAEVEEYASRRPKPSRSKAEALDLARNLAAEARRDPSRFADLARERSEDPFAPAGGELSAWRIGTRPDLDAVVRSLEVGAVSDPIDSEYGYRVLRRDPPLPEARLSARHLVVAWTGATRAPGGIQRDKAEARARAEALAERARRDPAAFEALIRAESDGWDRDRAGLLGGWTANGGRFPAAFDRAVHALAEGAISGPVESEFGFHVFQRLAPPPSAPMLAGAHILIAFEGAERAGASVRRSKAEAEAEARRVLEEARRDPARFGQLAQTRSDDATGQRGGDLGSFRRGSMPAAFEEALAALDPGNVGGPVLTQYGYHVLLRREAPGERPYVAP